MQQRATRPSLSKKRAISSTPRSKTKASAIETKRQDRRDFILDAATKLFAKRGYQATSMDDLSDATGMNKGTLYYYYKSKADILFDIAYSSSRAAIDVTTPPDDYNAAESIRYIVDAWVRRMHENWGALQVYFQEEHFFASVLSDSQIKKMRETARAFMKIHYDVIQKGVQSGEFRKVEVRPTARTMVSMLVGFYRWSESDRDFRQIVDTANKMMLSWLSATGANQR